MKYKVIETFREKHDGGKIYKEGKPYPSGKFKPTKKRIEELSSENNSYGRPFIKVVDEK